ncbi:site-specific DNA-methyltransferase [Salmonella enterica subsp. enterica serovar Newport]|nr:DNA modification methylase [Salmonella enterica subsp. enterica serovar Amager]EAV1017767.1 DNA modification methylase [Salmonella enterica]ECD6344183.1 DNA modification methylase [Salmonella enterica subsp. enterica serovar Newport]EAW7881454.1 site-specific DNA-methyltransferase [Salmonella enterica]EAX9170117.1 site-specific DNA-methyltransferase [Salmonella enterica]
MKLPVHRWFRYSAGFSAEWVNSEILKYQEETGNKAIVLEPFTGSGTTNISSDSLKVKSYGFEGHPFIVRIAKAKQLWDTSISDFNEAGKATLNYAMSIKSDAKIDRYENDNLLGKCYSFESFEKLDRLKRAYEKLSTTEPVWELIRLNITSILRACSHVGTAQWQYVLPNKSKSKVLDPFEAFSGKLELMKSDMLHAVSSGWESCSKIEHQDVRRPFQTEKCNLLISSPPYPNNYDYADATRLEMMFWGEINGWGDLKDVVRPSLMRSCSQHSAADKIDLDEYICNPLLSPIKDEIADITKQLDIIRHTKGGKKTYHTMIAAYFLDLAQTWVNLRKNMDKGSKVCFVIGDSAPYGIHVPAERWLGDLALSAGFSEYSFEKLRDRNVKWKNRTHTVPLHEGRLWIKG